MAAASAPVPPAHATSQRLSRSSLRCDDEYEESQLERSSRETAMERLMTSQISRTLRVFMRPSSSCCIRSCDVLPSKIVSFKNSASPYTRGEGKTVDSGIYLAARDSEPTRFLLSRRCVQSQGARRFILEKLSNTARAILIRISGAMRQCTSHSVQRASMGWPSSSNRSRSPRLYLSITHSYSHPGHLEVKENG